MKKTFGRDSIKCTDLMEEQLGTQTNCYFDQNVGTPKIIILTKINE